MTLTFYKISSVIFVTGESSLTTKSIAWNSAAPNFQFSADNLIKVFLAYFGLISYTNANAKFMFQT